MILDSKTIILIAVITTISIVLYLPVAAHSFENNQKASIVIGQKDFTLGSRNGGALLPSKISLNFPNGITFDSKGNLWVTDTLNHRVLQFPTSTSKNVSSIAADKVIGQKNFESRSANAGGISSSSLNLPYDVAFDLKGNLWVADAFNHRVLQYTPPFKNGQAASIVIGHKDFKSQFPNGLTALISPVPPPTPDSLFSPAAITFDPKGNLYVSDSSNHRIVGYAPPFKNGQAAFITIGQSDLKSGTKNAGLFSPVAGSLSTPFAITFSNSKLWIADNRNNRVLEYGHICEFKFKLEFVGSSFPSLCGDKDLSKLKTGQAADLVLGQSGFTSNAFVSGRESVTPFDVVQGPEDYLWVSDEPHNRILLYLPTTLDYCKELGTIDRSECQSWFNELANVFADVSFPDMTPAPYKNGQLPAKVIGQKDFESLGTGYRLDTLELSLNSPRGLAVDAEGNLWVADSGNHRVLEYNRYP